MKKILIIVLFVIPLNGYTQSSKIKNFFQAPAEALFSEPITESNLSKYQYFADSKYVEKDTYGGDLINGKKNIAVLTYIEKRAGDSLKVYYERKEKTRLRNLRLSQIADSIKQDSIQKVKIAEEIERAKWDSIRRAEKQEFFSIESIVENIGKNAYSKENIENSLHVYPSAYQGTWTFYELDDKFISIKYVGLEDICIELGFRLFGEDASFYKKELMNADFKYQKTFRDTLIENHSQGYSNLSGVEIHRYRKYTGKEYVICDIYYDQFTTFKFYRARYKK
ncbi:hypothetical protein [Dysgonomonas sp. ZJ709]|uniref:hypothetical protein n=1 Tax=Dysgonomonas sp. ZJ709 TaxID=2709797 RepID=UPI0013EA6C68|nr:hypothetical protein [Dysgonomonas sp. ZJ709]